MSGLRGLMLGLAIVMSGACSSLGAADRRPTVVFVHGWASDARVWTEVRGRLSFPSEAINLPGHGVPRAPGEVTLEGFSSAIETARAEAGSSCLLIVAHSNGAYAAREYARRHPRSVAALVIVEGTFRLPFADGSAFEAQIAGVEGRWASMQQNPIGLDHALPATARTVRGMFADADLGVAMLSLRALLAAQYADNEIVEAPVTFVLAESPFWTEAEFAAMRRAAPLAQFEVVGDSSHWLPLDAPHVLASVVERERAARRCPRT